MSPRVFLGLLVVTLITSVAAAVTVLQQPAATAVSYGDEPAFPALRANPDAVAKVVLTTPEGSFTLLRETGERWSAAERFGYAVDHQRVRDLVVALADMRLIEAKTKMPERYRRIEVEDVGAKDAKSRLLRLESADGEVLAEALIGKQQHRLTGSQSAGTYLRRPGEAQAWLASGGIQIESKVIDWLDPEIVDLDEGGIRRVEIRPEGSEAYVALRAAAGAPLSLQNLAEGETAKPAEELDRLASAFANVQLEDVKRRTELSWPSNHQTVIATTFDGVELKVELAMIGDEPWALFDAREVDPVAAEGSVASATGDQAAPVAEAAAQGSEAGGAADTPAELPKLTAGEINERVAGWAYKLPSHVFDRLTKPRAEWLDDSGTS